jgi:hypothetical protein
LANIDLTDAKADIPLNDSIGADFNVWLFYKKNKGYFKLTGGSLLD